MREATINCTAFLAELSAKMPELSVVVQTHHECGSHIAVAGIRQFVETAIDEGRLWQAELCFRAVEKALDHCEPSLKNALEVSFVEDFALGVITPEREKFVKLRLSNSMRKHLAKHRDAW